MEKTTATLPFWGGGFFFSDCLQQLFQLERVVKLFRSLPLNDTSAPLPDPHCSSSTLPGSHRLKCLRCEGCGGGGRGQTKWAKAHRAAAVGVHLTDEALDEPGELQDGVLLWVPLQSHGTAAPSEAPQPRPQTLEWG